MSEPRTIDPNVAGQAPRTERENHLSALGMRLRTIGDVPPLPAEEALWLLDELNKSEAEIERLKAEVADWQANVVGQLQEIERLKQELETLKAVSRGAIQAARGANMSLQIFSHQQISRLRTELAEARKPRLPVEPSPLPLVRELMAERDKLSEANMSLQRFSHEEISRLRMALQHYGQHDVDCSINVPYSPPRGFRRRPCGCGFSAALTGAAEPDKLETVQQNKLKDII